MQPSEHDGASLDDSIEKHFPNTAKLLHERESKSESPSRNRGASVSEGHADPDDQMADEDDEAAARLQERLAQAAARREKLLEARRLAQAEASANRKQKLEQVASLRRNAVRTFMQRAPEIMLKLASTGLTGDSSSTPDLIEQVLISDPRVCPRCGSTSQPLPPVCPQDHKPHRRSLVVLSETLLKMIGNTKVNLTPSKAASAKSDDTQAVAPRARRGIRVQPHLFVLAYYYASMPSPSALGDDGFADTMLLQHSAKHLVALIGQLHRLCAEYTDPSNVQSTSDTHQQLVADLLTSFAKTWRQYAKLAEAHAQPSPGDDPRDSAVRMKVVDELVQSTTDAVVAACVAVATLGDASLSDLAATNAFIDLMYVRLREIGGPDAVECARNKAEGAVTHAMRPAAKSEQAVTHDLSSPPLTPESKPRNPVAVLPVAPYLPSTYGGTSSDTDKGDGANNVVYGPDLPPNWFVDGLGVSRPPPPEMASALFGDKRQRLELRARTAFQTKLKLTDPLSQEETATEKLMSEMRDIALEKLKTDLNKSPPDLTRLPAALSSIADALTEALPLKLRGKIGKEIRDVLDWSAVRRNVRHSENNIAELMKYVVSRVIELGAPARDEPLRKECSEMEARLGAREDPLGDIVADVFRFMLNAIRQLRLDISAFTLSMISDELVKHTEEYHTELLQECFAHPTRWIKSIEFFQDVLNGDIEEVKGLMEQQRASGASVASTPLERVLRASLFLGVLDLLRSANRCAEDRWALLPTESMSVEKQQVFDAANAVQQDTLSLMLSGVVSMILQSKKLKDRTTLPFLLTTLDVKLREEFLPTATSVKSLQSSIQAEIDHLLSDVANCETPTCLSNAERAVLNSMIDKMTDTKTVQYATFESRVITAVSNAMLLESREAQAVPIAQRPKTIGLASGSAFKTGAKLRCVLDYHWSVLRSFYVEMSGGLRIPSALLEAAE